MSNRVLFIDLDDTLFEETDYVKSGFAEVSKYVAETNGIDHTLIYNQMLYQFNKYGRTGAFNRVMAHFEFETPSISDMVALYRDHKPNIYAYEGVYNSISRLRGIFDKIFIITDGIVVVQKNKVIALDLEQHVDGIIYCMEYSSPKPSTISIDEYTKNIPLDKNKSKMIGDDPYCDIECANKFGMESFRVLTGRFRDIRCEKQVKEFCSFCDVANFLVEDK